MDTDSQLLRRYHEERSEPAFTQLVQRHVGLVYSVALRRVGGDAPLAHDVAQKVFCDLARKAATLLDRATLAGWLYASAHLASAAVVRGEQRRKARESEAHFMQTTLASPESEADWNPLRLILDDVIIALKDQEREAIALRFFEKRSFADVGSALRITEEAARKRVDRALEKLRTLLGRRGVTSTAAALGLTLTAMSSVPVPAGVGAKVASHAFAQVGVSSGASLTGTLASASWLAAAAVLMVGGFLLSFQRHSNEELQNEITRLTAENREIAAIRTENQHVALHLLQAEKTARSSSKPPAPVFSSVVSVSQEGTLMWNRDRVTLDEFIRRLQQQATKEPESRINIRDAGAKLSQLNWVIDEVRKARISHVIVESNTALDPRAGDTGV